MLNLDLSYARAKFNWAKKHAAALDEELGRLRQRKPYAHRVTDVDQDTGWCEVFVRQDQFTDTTVPLIAADLINNLRTALNLVIPELLIASGITVATTTHQFPIYVSASKYQREVVKGIPSGNGQLGGIKHGLDVIRAQQPFVYSPSNPEFDALALLNHFSNADKHRLSFQAAARLEGNQSFAIREGGTPIETWGTSDFEMAINQDVQVAAFRFARPHPPKVGVEASFTVRPVIGVPGDLSVTSRGILITTDTIDEMFKRVAETVNQMAKL